MRLLSEIFSKCHARRFPWVTPASTAQQSAVSIVPDCLLVFRSPPPHGINLPISLPWARSGMWSIRSRKSHRQQHCLWMSTLARGQATPGAIIIIWWPVWDLVLLEPFQVWEEVTSRKTGPSGLACRNMARWFCRLPVSTLCSTVLQLMEMNPMETRIYSLEKCRQWYAHTHHIGFLQAVKRVKYTHST